MIKAVCFDWGNVLIDDPAPEFMRYCAAALGVSREEFSGIYQKYWRQFEIGTISENDLWKYVCSELHASVPDNDSLWGDAFRSAYRPNEEIFALASRLHDSGYMVGVLSNSEAPCVKYFHEQRYPMFDAVVFSCEERMSKRERRIFEIACERLNANPEETVFIDDKQEYIDVARSVGMHGILFRNPAQVKEELAASFSVRV